MTIGILDYYIIFQWITIAFMFAMWRQAFNNAQREALRHLKTMKLLVEWVEEIYPDHPSVSPLRAKLNVSEDNIRRSSRLFPPRRRRR